MIFLKYVMLLILFVLANVIGRILSQKYVYRLEELNEIKNKKQIGDKLTLTVWRDGKTQDIEVTLQEQPTD